MKEGRERELNIKMVLFKSTVSVDFSHYQPKCKVRLEGLDTSETKKSSYLCFPNKNCCY